MVWSTFFKRRVARTAPAAHRRLGHVLAAVVATSLIGVADAAGLVGAPEVPPVPGAIGTPLPSFSGATGWLNAAPLTSADLRGKVVLVEFWTYGCINCQHAIPHVRDWAERYKQLVVVGVHSPEFDAERQPANVQQAVRDLHLAYPIALDNDYAVWNAFGNKYWPAVYLVDARGRIRFRHLGEGAYAEQEAEIRLLLDEAHAEASGNRPAGALPAGR